MECKKIMNNDDKFTWLDLSEMSLLDRNVFNVCNLLINNNNHIIKINLSNNKDLTDKSIDYLFELLEKKKQIEKIDLYFNDKLSLTKIAKLNNKIIENVILLLLFSFY